MKRNAYKVLGAAVTLSMLGMGVTASPVFALPDEESVSTADPTFPSAEQIGSVTVTKYKGNPDDTKTADGTTASAPSEGYETLEGAGFTLYSIKKAGELNLSTNQGWSQLATLRNAVGMNPTVDELKGQGYTVEAVGEQQKTTGNGQVKFSNLPIGVYLLVETETPAGYAPSAPSVISVPMTVQSGDGKGAKWITDINVYPKNQPQTATKNILDYDAAAAKVKSGAELMWPAEALGDLADNKYGTISGQNMVYRIAGTVPQVANQKLTYWGISDKLPTTVTMGNTNTIKVFKLNSKTGKYTAINNYKSSLKDGVLTVWLVGNAYTQDLQEIDADTQVVVFFQVTAKAIADKTEIVNGGPDTAAKVVYTLSPNPDTPVTPGNPEEPGDTPPTDDNPPTPGSEVPTPPSVSKFGNVTFKKTNGTDPLDGAKFKLYYCADEAKTPINAGGTESGIVTSAAETGEFTITGLQYSNFKNGAAYDGFNTDKEYCLEEIQAPAGYELLPEPIKFNVTEENTRLMGNDNNIVNVPQNGGFRLPVTGANGLILLSVAGGLLIAGGVAFAVARRRREEA